MLDRLALRTAFWFSIALLSTACLALSFGAYQPPSFVAAAPFLAAVALLVAVTGWRLLHRELLRRMQEDATLQQRMRRLHDAMHGSMDGMLLLRAVRDQHGEVQDLEITEANERTATLLYRANDTLTGLRLRRDLPQIGPELFARYTEVITFLSPIHEEIRVNRRHVAASWVLHRATPTNDGVAVTLHDISQQKREQLRLRKASLTDDLTRLFNRRGFLALAEQQLRVARRQGKDAVVLYVDMNGFKELNDTFGHAVGDRALQAVARLLQATVRDCDVVARLGGDEFTILALDADGFGARMIQRRIEERVARFNASGELPTAIGLTIGHTRVRPSDPASVCELLARADQLLYARKRRRAATPAIAAMAVGASAPVISGQAPSAPSRGPRRTPRTVPKVVPPLPIPPQVAAVAAAAASARSLHTPRVKTMPSLPTERGITSRA